MRYGNSDPYCDQNGILKNKLGAKTDEELDLAENIFVLRKFTLLMENPIVGKFDFAHLKAIHRYLFEEVYPWAGKVRSISISKGNSMFAYPARIELEARKLFAQLRQEHYLQGLNKADIAKRLAYYLGEINMLHPFREGNGRTQRAFLILLARQAGYHLHFGQISPEEMIEASIQSQSCDYSQFETLIYARLEQQ